MLETRREILALITELIAQLESNLDEAETRRDLAERLLALDAEDARRLAAARHRAAP